MEEISVKLNEFPTIRVSLGNVSVNMIEKVKSHSDLSDRDLSDQHPISAITGLSDALSSAIGENELTAAVENALNEAKESGEFKGEKGDTGDVGPQGEKGEKGDTGADGKTAYSYAQDGGYEGTEEEFSAKLAEDAPKAFYVVITDNGDGTGVSDKSYEELLAAYENGSVIMCRVDNAETVGVIHAPMTYDGSNFGVGNVAADGKMWAAMVNVDGSVQVANVPLVPTALPNPNALTINGTSYDGSAAVEVDTRAFYINFTLGDMIDATTMSITSDKSFAEIAEAVNAGLAVFGILEGIVSPLSVIESNQYGFAYDAALMGGLRGSIIVLVEADSACALLMADVPVTVTESKGTYTSDVPFASIYSMLASGYDSRCTCDGATVSLVYFNEAVVVYGGIINGIQVTVAIDSSDAVTVTSAALITKDNDTKNTTGVTNKVGTKMYLVGSTSQVGTPVTYSNKNVYIGSDNRLYSNGEVVPNTEEIEALIDTKLAEIPNANGVSF